MAIDYHYEESLEESSTTSNDWQDKTEIELEVAEAGLYRVSWSLLFKSNNGSKDTSVRVLSSCGGVLCERTASEKNWFPVSGFRLYNFPVGTHTIKIQYRLDNNGTAYISNAVLDCWRAS